MQLPAWLNQPWLASILGAPRATRAIAGLAALQLGAELAGLSFWGCPSRLAFGFPCPGCGLTRASEALLHGHWSEAMHLHAYAPVLLLLLLLIAVAAVLPVRQRQALADRVAAWEQKTAFSTLLALGLVAYYVTRLAMGPRELQTLLAG